MRKRIGAAAAVLLVGIAGGCSDGNVVTALDDGVVPAFSHAGGGGSSIDQSQDTVEAAAPFTIAIGGNTSQLLAQLFTAGVTGKLRELEVPVDCSDGTLVAEIRHVASGLPGGVTLASESFAPSDLTPFIPGVATWSTLPFRPSPSLVAGTQYAMVFSNPTGSCGMLPSPLGDLYLGGDGYAFDDVNGAWVPIELGTGRFDIPFFTYMR